MPKTLLVEVDSQQLAKRTRREAICTECASVFIAGRGAPKCCCPRCSRLRRNRLRREARKQELTELRTVGGVQLPLRGFER